jgi:sec-independent protein translocase protein TatA
MFGISFEHILIVGVILILVGPKRLPELGNSIGKSIRNFKDSFNEIENPNHPELPKQEPIIAKTEIKNPAVKNPTGSDDDSHSS